MHGIYPTALLTTLVAVAIFAPLIHKLRMPANERLLWLAAALALPLQPLVFYCVRLPLDHWIVAHFGSTSVAYQWLVTAYAPLTEEPAKLLPLLIPAIRRDIRAENFLRYALAIGVAFAIGEMWFLAERLARDPAVASRPFYSFYGYFGERLMVCVFHTAFVSLSLVCLRRRFVFGFAGAMTLHWLDNFPIFLKNWNVGGLGLSLWTDIVQLWLLIYFVAALALLVYFSCRKMRLTASPRAMPPVI